MSLPAARFIHASNLVTYLSLLSGLLAVWAAATFQSWSLAGAFLALCSLTDTLDGKFARRFVRSEDQRNFGVHLDSLTDALNFGLIPVILLSVLTSPFLLWWAAAFFYCLSTITRLGAYNLHQSVTRDFVGLPSTVTGLIWSSLFLAEPSASATILILFACGLAMISSIPIPRPGRVGLGVFGAWAVLLIVLHGVDFIF